MTTLAAPTGNEIQTTIATGHSYTRGTTTDIYLTAHASFPNSALVVRIRNAGNTKWALVVYSTKTAGSPGYISMSAADDYALAKNVTIGDETYEWPAGSIVELVCAADEIAQLFAAMLNKDGTVALTGTWDAGEQIIRSHTITPDTLLDLIAGQIAFPATAIPSANANTLDDYEEGTFTPTIYGSITAGTPTYTIQVGVYTKIGNCLTIAVYVGISAKTDIDGWIYLGGLPFTAANVANQYASLVVSYHLGFTLAGTATHIDGLIIPNSAAISLRQGGAASDTALVDDAVIAAATEMIISGHYYI